MAATRLNGALRRARKVLDFSIISVACLAVALLGCGKRETKQPPAAIPFQLTERNGATALEFTNWTIVFEAIPARTAGIGSTGLIAVAGTAPGGEYNFQGMHLKQFGGKDANIISINKFTFKLMSSGRQIVFNDHAYELKGKPKEIVVSKEGNTREVGKVD